MNRYRANQGTFAASGYDVQLEWSIPIGPGQLAVNELYSIIDSFDFNGDEFSGTTSAAIGGAFPEYKSALSVSYNVGDWTLFGRWSYVPAVVSRGFGVIDGKFVENPTESPEASYFAVSARWNVTRVVPPI